jgi:predicted DNA-binding transcriptional regulator AlpA
MRDNEARSELLDDPALARLLDIPERTPGQWRYRGKGPRYIKVGRHVRYRRADVEAWLSDQSIDPSRRFAA